MNRPLSIVGIERIAPDGVVFLSYVRPDDQSRWAFKCNTDYPEVIWGKSDGRWRVHIDDPKIMFSVSGEVLTIMEDFGDGSSSIDTYDLSDF